MAEPSNPLSHSITTQTQTHVPNFAVHAVSIAEHQPTEPISIRAGTNARVSNRADFAHITFALSISETETFIGELQAALRDARRILREQVAGTPSNQSLHYVPIEHAEEIEP